MNNQMHSDRAEVYKREEEFHDNESRERKRISFFYAGGATYPIIDHAYKLIGELKGKKVLEIGCGYGSNLLRMVKDGACVTGIDISAVRVNEALSIIKRENIQMNANAIKMNAEVLEFPDGFFDVIFGSAILHHLDLDVALPEIKRVLKRGGKAVFIEPLGENPFINYYRKRTPTLRTEDEHPLIEKDFNLLRSYFTRVERKDFYLFTLMSYVFRTFVRNEKMFKLSNRALNKVDRILITILPFVGRYCWQTVIKLENN